jgi:alkylation response protein AidB-like acyl-CoA dehydrogenase
MVLAAVTLTDEQLELQSLARDFAQSEITPIAAERDRIVDPLEAFPWETWRKGAALGLRTLALPPEHGGRGMDILTHCVVLEELCAADAGFGAAFHQVWKTQHLLLTTEYLRGEILPQFIADDDYMLCLGFTEPDSGSDNLLPYEGPDGGARTTAVQQPNGDWIINGRKVFIFTGGLAKGCFVLCRTDTTKGMTDGATLFYVDHAIPGFRYGHIFSKLGWRLTPNAELIFEDVVVPDEARVSEVGQGVPFIGSFGKPHAATTAVFAVATARAALDLTLAWCNQRIQGGKPIIEHQSVAMRLADMWTDVDVARAYTWRAAWSAEHDPAYDVRLGPASQLIAAEMVVRVCYNAVQLWGGRGYMREYPIEKLLRDAFANYHLDGLNDTNRIRIGRSLAGKGGGGYIG